MPTRFGKGPIVTDAEIDEDMKIMADMGVTALRLAHMQHPPRVYEEADRLGILLTTEVPLIDDMDPSDDFRENLVQQMRELIAQTDNHPSVGLWGIGNELRTSGDAANRLLAALQSTAKELDPGRPTTYAHCCLDDDDSIVTGLGPRPAGFRGAGSFGRPRCGLVRGPVDDGHRSLT